MCDWWKPYCSHSGNMRVLLLWWVFAAFTKCPYDRCTTVFFLNRLRLELQTAPCEGIHRKVDMKGVFRVFLRNFDNDSYIVTKGAPVQSCRALTNHKSSQGVGWPTTSTGRVRLHFPSPNEQTVAAMGGNGNSCSNERQWKSFVYGFNNDLFLKNLDIAGLPYWLTWRHLDTFRCSYCTAAYQRHWQHSGQNMHQYSALISQSMLPQSLKLQLSSEDAHSCDRFSNLISNVLGLIHLPIIYVHEAILEHQFILIDASFVVLRRWWPLLAEPNGKQGQPVVMSKFKLMESFISYTSVCPIFRRAKCYHAFGKAKSYPCQVSKTLADRCFNHENRYVSSFQLLLHCLHVLNNPQSSTHEALDSLTMSHLFKAHSIHQNHTWNHIKLCFWGLGSHYCWSVRSTTSVLAVTPPPKNWQCSFQSVSHKHTEVSNGG